MAKLLHLDYIAFAIYLLMIVAWFSRTRKSAGKRSMFSYVLIVAFFATVYDICAVLMDNSGQGGVALKYVLHTGYLILRNAITPLLVGYIISVADTWFAMYKKKRLIFLYWLPFFIICALTLSSPFTHLVFYIDQNDVYTRGPLFFILYLSAVFYALSAILFSVKNKNILSYKNFIPLILIVPFQVMAVVIQFIYPRALCEMVTSALSLLLIMITIEKPEEKYDSVTGLYKYDLFMKNLLHSKELDKPYSMVLFNVTNYSALNSYLSFSKIQKMLMEIGARIEGVKSSLNLSPDIFNLENGLFAAIFYMDDIPYAPRFGSHLLETFNHEYADGKISVSILPNVSVINVPGDTDDPEKIRLLIKDFRNEKYSGELILASNILKIKDYSAFANMDSILSSAIANDEFEVYYQPIYSKNDNRFKSAEALIRLNTKEYGFIRPDLFIPMAEESGAIHEIGMIVLEKVCKFISSDKYKNLGLDYIEVNLSVVQCMDNDLVSKVEGICKKYNVDPSNINFEITETASSITQKVLIDNIESLNNKGFDFSLDDFGTGYSNLVRISSLPLHIVKLDRSFTWTQGNEKLSVILKKTISMIKQMGLEIVVEGVETEEMLNKFLDLGCEYIQGYYFSKPLPEYDFIQYITDKINPADN